MFNRQPDIRALGAASGTKMGRGYGGWKGRGEGGETRGGAAESGEMREGGESEDKDEDGEMGELPVDGPDDLLGEYNQSRLSIASKSSRAMENGQSAKAIYRTSGKTRR